MSTWPRRQYLDGAPSGMPAHLAAFDPEAWRDDDADEEFIGGADLSDPLWRACRDWHAACRWRDAWRSWLREHPEDDHRGEVLAALRAGRRRDALDDD